MTVASPRFLRFLATGGVAAAANIVMRYIFSQAMAFEVAVVLAYLAAMALAYLLARMFVFESSGRSVRSETTRFALVNVAALAIVWIVSVGLARIVFPAIGFDWHAETVAHIIGVVTPAITSYFGHLHYTFSRRPD